MSELQDTSESLPMEAVNDGYELLTRPHGYWRGNYHPDEAYLRRDGKLVKFWGYYPTLGELWDAYREHKEAAHV